MAYLTCIGGHGSVSKNVGGLGARGYWVFRRGKRVITRHGPVEVLRSNHVRFRWLYRKEVSEKTSSVQAAKRKVEMIIKSKTSEKHGYTRLPPGARIQ